MSPPLTCMGVGNVRCGKPVTHRHRVPPWHEEMPEGEKWWRVCITHTCGLCDRIPKEEK